MSYYPLLMNGKVGWEIPINGGIAQRYVDRIYLPPEGWQVLREWSTKDWKRGDFGELRLRKHKKELWIN